MLYDIWNSFTEKPRAKILTKVDPLKLINATVNIVDVSFGLILLSMLIDTVLIDTCTTTTHTPSSIYSILMIHVLLPLNMSYTNSTCV